MKRERTNLHETSQTHSLLQTPLQGWARPSALSTQAAPEELALATVPTSGWFRTQEKQGWCAVSPGTWNARAAPFPPRAVLPLCDSLTEEHALGSRLSGPGWWPGGHQHCGGPTPSHQLQVSQQHRGHHSITLSSQAEGLDARRDVGCPSSFCYVSLHCYTN